MFVQWKKILFQEKGRFSGKTVEVNILGGFECLKCSAVLLNGRINY